MKEPNPLVYYPIFLNLEGKKCVVVGGGEVALRKVRALLDSGARVVVVSPTLNPGLAQLARVETISLISREYEPKDQRINIKRSEQEKNQVYTPVVHGYTRPAVRQAPAL